MIDFNWLFCRGNALLYNTIEAKTVVTLYSKAYNCTPDLRFAQILTAVFNKMTIKVKLDKNSNFNYKNV